MKRTIPLVITSAVGFVLIIAFFIPLIEKWGEIAMIWFDILAAIAFILGGGNLLRVHLKKVSDRVRGWAYSVITIVAFLGMLFIGLTKYGATPAPQQEFYGETFASLSIADFPQEYTIDGSIPERAGRKQLPASVRRQLTERDGKLVFKGWMSTNETSGDQKKDLLEYQEKLAWQATIEQLHDLAQPPKELRGKVHYHADRQMLSFKGHMTDEQRDTLLALYANSEPWKKAVAELYERAKPETSVEVDKDSIPAGFTAERAKDKISKHISFDEKTLGIVGPMSSKERSDLKRQFPVAMPMAPAAQANLRNELTKSVALTSKQTEFFDAYFKTQWNTANLATALNDAGKAQMVDKTARELLAEREEMEESDGTRFDPELKKKVGEDQALNDAQLTLLQAFVDAGDGSMVRIDETVESLRSAGPLSDAQAGAFRAFLAKNPTVGERQKDLCILLLQNGPLSDAQRNLLLGNYRNQRNWESTVEKLFDAAHQVKYQWSGDYRGQGTAFWWMYEYAFKPLTATMFAMLAFYVASAAFRAFRAKNIEAILLLGTAFVILLGRTFAGAVLTDWLPTTGPLSMLRVENLTLLTMMVFNTAGNRAIMIGIALGIVSTSLKVLLGIDRSYLGSGEE